MAQGIREILDSREREVRRAIDDIRNKQLAPLERELKEIIAARQAIGTVKEMNQPDLTIRTKEVRYMHMTYEQLAEEALSQEFRDGATIKELLGFIRERFCRDIAQGSFSPVLSRMRDKGAIEKCGKAWRLAEKR